MAHRRVQTVSDPGRDQLKWSSSWYSSGILKEGVSLFFQRILSEEEVVAVVLDFELISDELKAQPSAPFEPQKRACHIDKTINRATVRENKTVKRGHIKRLH